MKECAEQLFLQRKEFYFRRQNEVMKKALQELLVDTDDNVISNIVHSILEYIRNHWTKKGKPYHEMWMKEKKTKKLDFKQGERFQRKSPQKSPVTAKAKVIKLPEISLTESELDGIRADLKRIYQNNEEGTCDETIARLLETSYYERIYKLRATSVDYTFKKYIQQYPILSVMRWLYYEWKLVKAYVKEDCSLEFDEFEEKLLSICKFMAYYVIHCEEHSLLLDIMQTFFKRKAKRNIEAREELVDDDSLKQELHKMHRESALHNLLESDDWQQYSDHLLLSFIRYMEDGWRGRESRKILVECTTRTTTLEYAYIAAMNPRSDGTYRSYSVVIDKYTVYSDQNLAKVFVMYYCACDLAARDFGHKVMKTFIDEAIVGESRVRGNTYRAFIVKLMDVYETR